MRKIMLSLAAVAALGAGTVGSVEAAPLGTVVAMPGTTAAVPDAAVQTVQYYGYGRPYYHHRWHH